MIITLIFLILIVSSFFGAFGGIIKFWYNERKAKKEFEKRQERYKEMI